ncbi:hypothetical protein MASR2M78_36520 [Treponema sp.]
MLLLNEANLTAIITLHEALYEDAKTLFIFPENVTFRLFYTDDRVAKLSPRNMPLPL